MDNPDVLVVGGGLAGISAALRLADLGRAVTLLEARPRLGGAAVSFQRDGLSIDNGQHIFLRCCTAYREFLDRIGAADRVRLQSHLDVRVKRPDGTQAALSRTPRVPAPLHLARALARYRLLSPYERALAVGGAVALRTLNPANGRLDERTFGQFLRRHRQSKAIADNLWGVLVTATLNIDPEEASLQLAAKVFRTGLLDSADAADVGHAIVPLGEIHHDLALTALRKAGVEVRLNARLERIGGAAGVDADHGLVMVRERATERILRPGAVVLAVPAYRLSGIAGVPAQPASRLGSSPIVNVHVIYDRAVTELDFSAAVRSPVQWVFDRTSSSGVAGQHPGAQYLAITVSAADELIDRRSQDIIDEYRLALAELFPAAKQAVVLDAFVTRERRATFRQAAGSGSLRPLPGSSVFTPSTAGLVPARNTVEHNADQEMPVVLAGAWTATGWPDTMESAVRSGQAAASVVNSRSAMRSRTELVDSVKKVGKL